MVRLCLQRGLRSYVALALLLASAITLLPAAARQSQARAERRVLAQANAQGERQPDQQFRRAEQGARKAAPNRGAAQEARVIERLLRMPPEQRRRTLQGERFRRLPAAQQRRIVNRIQRLSQLPPQQQRQVLERFRLFDQLPPERQTQARQVYRRWRAISESRRAVLLEEFDGIRDADPGARQARFDDKEFQKKYNDEERGVLQDLAGLLPDAPEKQEQR